MIKLAGFMIFILIANAGPGRGADLLTPSAPHEPRLHGPKVEGVRPGSPFLYRIPCTGDRPLSFRAEGLPPGLSLDAASGIITGKIAQAGTYRTTLFAKNALGEDQRAFRIEAGDKLALTPPMGWNSWYIYYNRVTEANLRDAADQMIASGMADYGYRYVNCDDCWAMKKGTTMRSQDGTILPNANFPDMKGLVDYIHAKGLKAGIYTSPGPLTCGGYTGSWQHEAQDARTFAGWGMDFLKYDLCSYAGLMPGAKTPDDYRKPYQLMSDELRKQDRDIVFNLCEYGDGDVWKWGGEVGQCWRTTGDLGLGYRGARPSFYGIAFSNAQHAAFAKPGAWNDPDYLLIGWVGNAHTRGVGKQTTLTADEQYSYMSLWSLMAAPLIFSGDMTKLDAFTLNVLCNAEVIDVDQDPLGQQAKILRKTADEFVLVKELEGGAKAVGLFNLSATPRTISISWTDLTLSGTQPLHDIWRQKDLAPATDAFALEIAPHGVAFMKIGPTR